MEPLKTPALEMDCLCCACAMVQAPVEVTYLGQTYPVNLMTCPNCGQVYLSEEVRDKMRMVEDTLEEK